MIVQDTKLLALQLPDAPLASIASIIKSDWARVSPYAHPYLRAMFYLSGDDSKYGLDDAKTIVLYFLANAGTWRGPVAKLVKAELKRRFKIK